MAVYLRGSGGQEVRKIQEKLAELGLYSGPIDGDFGGGTERGVRAFQKSRGLVVDGIVGKLTWEAMFGNQYIPEPIIASKPLIYRCLALTGSFETGKRLSDCMAWLSGDFDGQGFSLGALQWNLGQGTLQPLLMEMNNKHGDIVRDIFDRHYVILSAFLGFSYDKQMQWARSIQHPVRHYIYEPWQSLFRTLARTEEFEEIQIKYASMLYDSAINLCKVYRLWSERAVALMFDIKVQNGSIRLATRSLIEKDFQNKGLQEEQDSEGEEKKMVIIANRRAEASRTQWIEDVRRRKLTIATGCGYVHGTSYNLEEQYGIGLRRLTRISR